MRRKTLEAAADRLTDHAKPLAIDRPTLQERGVERVMTRQEFGVFACVRVRARGCVCL